MKGGKRKGAGRPRKFKLPTVTIRTLVPIEQRDNLKKHIQKFFLTPYK